MPISWNEIKNRAFAFSKEWADEASEDAEAKSFWDGFFHIFGISRRRIASFEEPVKKLGSKQGFIDLFWKGVLLVEHKSRGKNLDKAYTQALDYFPGIAERDLPKYILVSDFVRLRLYDLENNDIHEFELQDLHKNVKLFGFVAGYQTHKIQEQDPVNIHAAELMGKLHDLMREVGYEGHELELYLVRLLFCMFAEDTGIFERQQFQDYIEERTSQDGSDLAHHINTIFQILNTPEQKRFKNLDEQLAAFPYINGKLFEEMLPTASFDNTMRQNLLDCCALDWSRISPAIFGSLFQSIMDKTARRNLGAHYTSENNILKLIKPLFLDALREEFEKIKNNKNRLIDFHNKLRSLTFLDPACGCGNFLVITYRELRLLELDILRALKGDKQQTLDLNIQSLIKLNVDQFYGIEIEEFPAQIAQVALWLIDHQMNQMVSEEFGLYFARIPLISSSTIVCGNALQIDWNEVIPAEKLSYIMGNPPFVGYAYQNKNQKADLEGVLSGLDGAGVLDFVAGWYVKAARIIQTTPIRCAFVSTNSITQGEQVGVLWSWMLAQGIKIFFAHRTFAWNSEARGKAAVHCVIVGFAAEEVSPKWLFEYEDIKGEPHQVQVKNINPYLVDAPTFILQNRRHPICEVLPMRYGSKPVDGSNLLLSDSEKKEILQHEPVAEEYIRPFLNAEEFLHNVPRYCLWLVDCPPQKLQQMPYVMKRIEKVRNMRIGSSKLATRELALMPTLFAEIRQAKTNYLLVPCHTSENRTYIPVGYFDSDVICGNANFQIPEATFYDFGVLTSLMHNAWMRTVCGRLKSDYRYSAGIVYNNFLWPQNPTEKQKQAIETAAQEVLDARAQFPDSSLADLYDPLTMPPILLKAHQKLDKAVDTAYGKTNFKTEAERVAFLFELYQKYVSCLPEKTKSTKKSSTKNQ
ncbi:MAG: class I SAM-dependent DNA methyltransferase [Desulfamplus sp.]|nr:class I SAM-dependent DNA methyltransferase [Desulfamplus sp.]